VVKRTLDVSTKDAREAWLTYHFEKGGDLPLVFSFVSSSSSNKRLLLPAGVEESLLPENCGDVTSVAYTVSDFGPLLGLDFIPGSHLGNVTFIETDNNRNQTEMTWSVTCQTKQRSHLWKFITTFLITTVCDHLVEYTSIPYLYTQTTYLPFYTTNIDDVIDDWKTFVWKQGGKLPCYPPISSRLFDDGNTRIYFPPGLVERILMTEENEIHYRVVNPGYLSFYPVYSHKGRVRFVPDEMTGMLQMIWQVEIRPKQPYKVVQGFTSAIISNLSRNFQLHLQQKYNDNNNAFLERETGHWERNKMPP